MLGNSGGGMPVTTWTIGAIVRRMCEIFSASSAFRDAGDMLSGCMGFERLGYEMFGQYDKRGASLAKENGFVMTCDAGVCR